MMRPARLAVVALLLASACVDRPTPAGEGVDAPANAGSTKAEQTAAKVVRGARTPARELASDLAVAVASTERDEARPCEQLCGRVGDCLRESGDRPDRASHLELECLDACVHSPAEDPAHQRFLACGEARQDCAAVTSCAEQSWDALLAAKITPEIEVFTEPARDCVEICHWLVSCVLAQVPPHANPADLDMHSAGCIDNCNADEAIKTDYARYYECMKSSCGDPYSCFN